MAGATAGEASAGGAVAFLCVAMVVFHVLRVLQDASGGAATAARQRRRRAFKGGVQPRSREADVEWVVRELLNDTRARTGGRRRRSGQADLLPPEWAVRYPWRATAHDHDNAGTTVRLSTGDMISMRWDLPLCVCLELGLFADLIVKDFILCWYSTSISNEPQFPDDVRSVLQNVLGKLGDRVLSINLPMFLLCDMSYVLRHHLRWFTELKERARKRCHPPEEFDAMAQDDKNNLLLDEFRRAGHLHPACSITGQTEDPRTVSYIRSVTSELLVRLLPEEDYHCAALRHLVREVLTCNVLVPALESIGPEVINNMILQALRGTSAEEETAPESDAQGDPAPLPAPTPAPAPAPAPVAGQEVSTGEGAEHDRLAEAENGESVKPPEPTAHQIARQSSKHALDKEKCAESIAFIQEASSEMRKEESSRLMVELRAALGECVASFTEDPDTALGNDSGAGRQLLRVLDAILSHGLQLPAHSKAMREEGLIACADGSMEPGEAWWEFARHVSELVPATSMTTNAIDSCVEAIYLDLDDYANGATDGATASKKDTIDSDASDGSSDEEAQVLVSGALGSGGPGRRESKDASGNASSPLSASRPPGRSGGSRTRGRSPNKLDFDREVLQPGKAWLAMMLKHKLLAQAIGALLEDKVWADLHYAETAAVRCDKLLPALATLNGVEFDFDLTRFWKRASKVRKRLERRGVKSTRQEKLRRMRKRLAGKLAKNVQRVRRKGASDRSRGDRSDSGGGSVSGVGDGLQHEQAIIALQDRVGPIRATISSFTLRHERGGVRSTSFVQYIVQCSLTRREDNKVSSWAIYRRYSQFSELHAALRSAFGHRFDDVQMPKKGGFTVFSSQSVGFINRRKADLETYLQQLLEHPAVCDSEALLTFLSPQSEEELDGEALPSSETASGGLASPSASSAKDHDEEAEVTSQSGQGGEESKEAHEGGGGGGGGGKARSPAKAPRRGTASKHSKKSPRGDKEPKIDPYELRIAEGHIYKLAQEIFEFHELDVVRRNLISILRSIVSLVFHGTAHRWLQNNYTRNASAEILANLLSTVRELLWPNGEFMVSEEEQEPTPEELAARDAARDECLEALLAATPPQMITFLGKRKSQACCTKLHEFLQHPSLIHNLVFTTMDLLLLRIFPDLPLKELHERSVPEDSEDAGQEAPVPAAEAEAAAEAAAAARSGH